jgi:hypothetical protein
MNKISAILTLISVLKTIEKMDESDRKFILNKLEKIYSFGKSADLEIILKPFKKAATTVVSTVEKIRGEMEEGFEPELNAERGVWVSMTEFVNPNSPLYISPGVHNCIVGKIKMLTDEETDDNVQVGVLYKDQNESLIFIHDGGTKNFGVEDIFEYQFHSLY